MQEGEAIMSALNFDNNNLKDQTKEIWVAYMFLLVRFQHHYNDW